VDLRLAQPAQVLELAGANAQMDVRPILAAGGAQADGVADEGHVVLVDPDKGFSSQSGRGEPQRGASQ
jgi:hypothetical protein